MSTKEIVEEKQLVKSEVEEYAKFDILRYAQVWEDADILIQALDIHENDNILSIASAGENTISMLIKNPNKVFAIDLSENQIACTELKIVAYKYLDYQECMEFIGVFDCNDRIKTYQKIADKLSKDTRTYLESNLEMLEKGIIHTGKFEKYFHLFGKKILPFIHKKSIREELLQKKTKEERIQFYDQKWNNMRWKMLFRIFFSKTDMGKLGRDKAFFRYVHVNVAEHILERTKYAITELDTSENSYLQYIIHGKYDENVLPVAYRKENFEIIKKNIDKIYLLKDSVEDFIQKEEIDYISKYNLSDIFEYMSDEQMCKIFEKIFIKSAPGTRNAYRNMLADKRASKYFDNLVYKEKESKELFKQDKAFFYSKFIIEQVI